MVIEQFFKKLFGSADIVDKKKTTLLLSKQGNQLNTILTQNEDILEFHVEEDNAIDGSIYVGEIKKIIPRSQLAFVDIGGQEGVLHKKDLSKRLLPHKKSKNTVLEQMVEEGDKVLVQIVKEAVSDKRAVFTNCINLSGKYIVFNSYNLPLKVSKKISLEKNGGVLQSFLKQITKTNGIVIRTAAWNAEMQELTNEYNTLQEKWDDFSKNYSKKKVGLIHKGQDLVTKLLTNNYYKIDSIITDNASLFDDLKVQVKEYLPHLAEKVTLFQGKEALFDYFHLRNLIKETVSRKIKLSNGVLLEINETKNATVFFINTENMGDVDPDYFAINQEAVIKTAQQIRFRNLSGNIILHCLDMDLRKNKLKIEDVFQKEMKKDTSHYNFDKSSKLNLFFLRRKRLPLASRQSIFQSCHQCQGKGYIDVTGYSAMQLFREIEETVQQQHAKKILLVTTAECAYQILNTFRRSIQQLEDNNTIVISVEIDKNMRHSDESRLITDTTFYSSSRNEEREKNSIALHKKTRQFFANEEKHFPKKRSDDSARIVTKKERENEDQKCFINKEQAIRKSDSEVKEVNDTEVGDDQHILESFQNRISDNIKEERLNQKYVWGTATTTQSPGDIGNSKEMEQVKQGFEADLKISVDTKDSTFMKSEETQQ